MGNGRSPGLSGRSDVGFAHRLLSFNDSSSSFHYIVAVNTRYVVPLSAFVSC